VTTHRLRYKCRKCKRLFTITHHDPHDLSPTGFLETLILGGTLPGTRTGVLGVHGCKDGGAGVAEVVGLEVQED
jgi:hypothetical protein